MRRTNNLYKKKLLGKLQMKCHNAVTQYKPLDNCSSVNNLNYEKKKLT